MSTTCLNYTKLNQKYHQDCIDLKAACPEVKIATEDTLTFRRHGTEDTLKTQYQKQC